MKEWLYCMEKVAHLKSKSNIGTDFIHDNSKTVNTN